MKSQKENLAGFHKKRSSASRGPPRQQKMSQPAQPGGGALSKPNQMQKDRSPKEPLTELKSFLNCREPRGQQHEAEGGGTDEAQTEHGGRVICDCTAEGAKHAGFPVRRALEREQPH